MLQALIITLREGVEAALIVGITLAYLQKIGRPGLRKSVYAALISAFLASIAAAVVVAKLEMNPDIFEGWVMLLAAVFVVSMLVFMAKAAKTIKGDIETRVGGFATAGSKIGLFLFVFLMVLREGVETVLILSAVTLSTSELLSFLGTLAGVALSIVFGVMFVKGSVRVNLRKFFRVTTVILVFVALQLTITGLHELSENGVLPSTKREMALIGPIVRNSAFFTVTLLALAALMVLFEWRRRSAVAESSPEITAAERRKRLWSQRRERLWMASVYVSSFVFILLVTAEFIYAKSTSALSPAVPVQFVNGSVELDTSNMQPGELRRYESVLHGQPVRFLIYKKPDSSVVTVLDACAICGTVGFYRDGAHGLVCKNCDAPVNPQTVGEGGGCNPIPLTSEIKEGKVRIAEKDLEASSVHVRSE